MKTKTCCFIGHRNIEETEELRVRLLEVIEDLITKESVETFLFGSKSSFNSLCYEIVDDCKEKYPHIKRIYVRAEYPYISDDYKNLLLRNYEDTYYPESILGAGRAVYVERNYEMIRNSDVCVIYYHKENIPTTRRSSTEIALRYARKQKKRIIAL